MITYAQLLTLILSALFIFSQLASVAQDALITKANSADSKELLHFMVSLCDSANPFDPRTITNLTGGEPRKDSTPTSQSWDSYGKKGLNNVSLCNLKSGDKENPRIAVNLLDFESSVRTSTLLEALHLSADKNLALGINHSRERTYQLPWGILSISTADKYDSEPGTIKHLELYTADSFKTEIATRLKAKGSELLSGKPLIGEPGNPQQALTLLNDSIEANPNDVWSFRLRARANAALHNYEESLADATKALEIIDQKDTSTYLERARILQLMQRHSEALEDCDQALAICRSNSDRGFVQALRGRIFLDLHAYKEAIRMFTEAINSTTDYSSQLSGLYLQRAKAKQVLGDNIGANDDFKQAAIQKATRMEYNNSCVIGGPVQNKKPSYFSSQIFIAVLAMDLAKIMQGPNCDQTLDKLSLYISRPTSRRDLFGDLASIARNQKPFELERFGLSQDDLRNDFPQLLKLVGKKLADEPSTEFMDYRRVPYPRFSKENITN